MKALNKAFRRKAKVGEKSSNVAVIDASGEAANATVVDDLLDDEQENPNIAKALSELKNATSTFEERYVGFVKKNQQYLKVDDDVYKSIEKAGKDQDIRRSAALFGKEISSAVQVRNKKTDLSKARWLGKLSNFMSEVYPVARLSLRLTSTVADVASL